MTARLRPVVVLAVAVAAGPASAYGEALVASGEVESVVRPTTLSAHLVTLAYSAYDPASDSYRLRVKVGSRPPRDVPVAPRKVPFDVDAGRAYTPPAGHEEVLVYSRCRSEPRLTGHRANPVVDWPSARGCTLYRATAAGGEKRIGGAGEGVLPTLSGSDLAAVRERPGAQPVVVIHRLGARPGPATVVHGPATRGAAGPLRLDVASGRLAITLGVQPHPRPARPGNQAVRGRRRDWARRTRCADPRWGWPELKRDRRGDVGA